MMVGYSLTTEILKVSHVRIAKPKLTLNIREKLYIKVSKSLWQERTKIMHLVFLWKHLPTSKNF